LRQGRQDRLRRDTKGGETGLREVDEDPFRALADDIDLLDARDVKQPLAQRFGLTSKLALRIAFRLQRVERECHITIFVVDERTGDAAGQIRRLVPHLLASLVEFRLDLGRRRIVAQTQRDERKPRPGEGLGTIIPAQLLQPLFERLGDLVLHFLGGRSRPARHHRDRLDGEARVFGAAEAEEGDYAGNRNDDDEE
jgi:hypothetical protein